MKRLNVAILGLGKIGLGYDLADSSGVMSHTKAFLNNPQYHLILGVDFTETARSNFEDFSKAKSFSNVEEIPEILASEVDIVVIATPSITRVKDCEKTLEKFLYIKYIVLEKPLALTLLEARLLRSLFDKSNLIKNIFVNYMRRCDPHFIDLRKRIRAGEWGEVKKINLSYPGDFINMGSHFIDLINFFFDLDFKVVSKKNFYLKPNNDFSTEAELVAGEVNLNVYSLPEGKLELVLFFENQVVKILNSGWEIMIGDKKVKVDLSRYQEFVVEHLSSVLEGNEQLVSDFNTAEKALVLCENIRKF